MYQHPSSVYQHPASIYQPTSVYQHDHSPASPYPTGPALWPPQLEGLALM